MHDIAPNGITRRSLFKLGGAAAAAAVVPGGILGTPPAEAAQTTSPGGLKGLAFDIQGSTVDFYTPLMTMGQRVNRDKHLSLDWGKLSTEWRNGYRDVMDEILSGKRDYITTEAVYRIALDRLIAGNGLEDRFSVAERDEMNLVWGDMIPWKDSVPGLTRMRKRFTLTALSNAGMPTVVHIVKTGHLPFDAVLTGQLARSFKPSPDVYRLAVDNLGFDRSEIMMVATHKYDLKGAKAFGFRTAFIPRPLEFGPATKVDGKPEDYIDVMAEDFVDLAAKLGA